MVYIHVPFCRSFCTYCGFYSELCSGGEGQLDAYVDALAREIALRGGDRAYSTVDDEYGVSADTLYIGGGTPSVLPLSAFERIYEALRASGACSPFPSEFTVEVNPDDILRLGLSYVRGLKSLGVNRVSMGVQSFDDGLLHCMNRRHTASQAKEAFALLREGGFDNISIDLIFGIGTFTRGGVCLDDETWRRSIEQALALKPEHISAYQLSVEPDSALEKLLADGRYVPAPDEFCAGQYMQLCSMLSEAGYLHYEISNFALPGRDAVHNSLYWRHVPYLGFGPAAHSFGRTSDGRWLRSWNPDSLGDYLERYGTEETALVAPGAAAGDVTAGAGPVFGGSELLDADMFREEEIMLGLRTFRGIDPCLLSDDVLERELAAGNLVRCDTGVRIPESRFFVSDSIIAGLI